MRTTWKPARLAKVLLPLLVMVVLGLAPRAYRVVDALELAKQARVDGRPRVAAAFTRAAAQDLPWRSDLWEQAGVDAMAASQAGDALDALERAAALDGLGPAGRIALGDAQAHTGDLPGALHIWQTELEREGPSAELYRRIADVQRRQGDLPALIVTLDAWHALAPADAAVLYQLGLARAAQDPEEGLRKLMQVAALDPRLAAAVRQVQAGVNTGAAAGDAAYTLLTTGRALGGLEQWDLAAAAFTRAIGLRPDYAEAHAFLGEALQHLGEDGLPELKRAQALAPESVLVQALQAVYWQRNGKPELALVYLHQAAALEPENPAWQAELGDASARLGNMNAALEYYQRAAGLDPQNPLYLRLLAAFTVAYDLQVREVGLPAARQAVVLAPDDPAALDVMGQVLYLLGDFDSAQRFFLRAIQRVPEAAAAHLHLGLVYREQGQLERAYEEWTRVIALDPQGADGDQAQRLLRRYFP